MQRLAFVVPNCHSLYAESRCQSFRVKGSVDLGVVVEVNKNIKTLGPPLGMRDRFGIVRLFSTSPLPDAVGPPVERFVVVTADVKFFRAVQADVNEIGGQIFSVRKFPGGVGKDKSDFLLAQQIEEIRHHEAFVPNLQRIMQWPGDIHLRPSARLQIIIVMFGKLCRAVCVARQQFKKFFQAFPVPAEVWRELPENWAKLFAKSEHARSEKVGKRHLNAAQLFHMRDVTRAFDCENKIIRRV
jgi:hypothetical protein